MPRIRLIARLDIKGANLIKGINLEGLRVIGDPNVFARKYDEAGIDEIIYMDSVASLYGRNSLSAIVEKTTSEVFIPITVGGGLRTLEDVQRTLRSGADKVAINTAAIRNPEFITEVANRFGSQAMVLSVEAKRTERGNWEAYYNCGREKSDRDVVEWVQEAVERGAGEVLLTSVDREGTRRGFDIELVKAVTTKVRVPVIASGGMGTIDHLIDVLNRGKADAVAMADILHYNRETTPNIRQRIKQSGFDVRTT